MWPCYLEDDTAFRPLLISSFLSELFSTLPSLLYLRSYPRSVSQVQRAQAEDPGFHCHRNRYGPYDLLRYLFYSFYCTSFLSRFFLQALLLGLARSEVFSLAIYPGFSLLFVLLLQGSCCVLCTTLLLKIFVQIPFCSSGLVLVHLDKSVGDFFFSPCLGGFEPHIVGIWSSSTTGWPADF